MRAPTRTLLALPALALFLAVVMGSSPATAISERAGARLQRAPERVAHAAPAVPSGGNGLIAFQSDRGVKGTQLFTMDTDGSGVAQLTFHNQSSTEVNWSPDGTGLAYSNCCPSDTSKREVYSVNANGDGRVRLTDNDARDVQPAWSPDGSKIAFASRRDGNWEIYAMNADGSGQVNLTDDSHSDKSPAWGPQGNWIAFSSNRGSRGNWQVYKMKTDGSDVTRLTGADATSNNPSWSPDGSDIAFETDRTGNWDVFTMRSSGADETALTTDTHDDRYPSWSPNGAKVAFASNRSGNWDVFKIKTDGTDATNLTDDPADDTQPDWQADTTPMYRGIDASHWQGTIDWGKVAGSGIRFSFLKASEGTSYVDPTYADNRAEANDEGITVGAYHFAQPDTDKNDAEDEADHFVDVADVNTGDIVPVLDLEASNGLSVSDLQDWTFDWLEEVEAKTGVKPMIYTGPWFWETFMGDTTAFADAGYELLWIANWFVSDPDVPGADWGGLGWTFWQYDDCGFVSGIAGCVDLDYFNGVNMWPAQVP
jgi:GH25 family lysozyme M1 (1,4-beta-N-acetylmuramidase)